MTEEQEKHFNEGIESLMKLVAEHAVGIKRQMASHTGEVLANMSVLDRKLDRIVKHLKIPDEGK